MAGVAEGLTGRAPTHIVLTHFHGDHTGGIAGYGRAAARAIRVTATTRDLVREQDAREPPDDADLRAALLGDAVVLRPDAATAVDLGDRTVRLIPRAGHTPSDVTVELDDPGVVFCGDLVWNRMFPNYRDAIPSMLGRDVRGVRRPDATTYVPGHGPVATPADLDRYIALIDDVEAHARRAIEAGEPAVEAAARYQVPGTLGEWLRFSDRYVEVAFRAWERELALEGR
jgi:glyoxylase-like metal-dependent hydrolase (beta-lactamase superfamily II)